MRFDNHALATLIPVLGLFCMGADECGGREPLGGGDPDAGPAVVDAGPAGADAGSVPDVDAGPMDTDAGAPFMGLSHVWIRASFTNERRPIVTVSFYDQAHDPWAETHTPGAVPGALENFGPCSVYGEGGVGGPAPLPSTPLDMGPDAVRIAVADAPMQRADRQGDEYTLSSATAVPYVVPAAPIPVSVEITIAGLAPIVRSFDIPQIEVTSPALTPPPPERRAFDQGYDARVPATGDVRFDWTAGAPPANPVRLLWFNGLPTPESRVLECRRAAGDGGFEIPRAIVTRYDLMQTATVEGPFFSIGHDAVDSTETVSGVAVRTVATGAITARQLEATP